MMFSLFFCNLAAFSGNTHVYLANNKTRFYSSTYFNSTNSFFPPPDFCEKQFSDNCSSFQSSNAFSSFTLFLAVV